MVQDDPVGKILFFQRTGLFGKFRMGVQQFEEAVRARHGLLDRGHHLGQILDGTVGHEEGGQQRGQFRQGHAPAVAVDHEGQRSGHRHQFHGGGDQHVEPERPDDLLYVAFVGLVETAVLVGLRVEGLDGGDARKDLVHPRKDFGDAGVALFVDLADLSPQQLNGQDQQGKPQEEDDQQRVAVVLTAGDDDGADAAEDLKRRVGQVLDAVRHAVFEDRRVVGAAADEFPRVAARIEAQGLRGQVPENIPPQIRS